VYFVDFKGAAGEIAAWNFYACDDGRYSVSFEYSAAGAIPAFTARTEHMEVDHSYVEQFDLETTESWTDWQRKAVTMDFHQGLNTLQVEPHTDSEFHLRAVHVLWTKHLPHCTPGERVPINWLDSATTQQNMLSSDGGVTQGQASTALLEGGVDLEAFGPWLLKFEVNRDAAPSSDALELTINKKQVTRLHDEEKVYFQDKGGFLHYSMAFTSQGTNAPNRILVTNAYAECKGCSHTHCRLVKQAEHTTARRVSVHHHNAEFAGKQHHCKWNGNKGYCQCSCQDEKFTKSISFNHFQTMKEVH
jgi:hypothetical protein